MPWGPLKATRTWNDVHGGSSPSRPFTLLMSVANDGGLRSRSAHVWRHRWVVDSGKDDAARGYSSGGLLPDNEECWTGMKRERREL